MKVFLGRRSALQSLVMKSAFVPLLFSLTASVSFAGGGQNSGTQQQQPAALECNDANNSSTIAANPGQVHDWIVKNQLQFHGRALVAGTFVRDLPATDTHDHFEMTFNYDPQANATQRDQASIEVVYNKEFGALPSQMAAGASLVVCGDYITIGNQGPLGAIIHWVHFNPGNRDGGRHPNGYVVVNQKLYGDQGDYLTQRVQQPAHGGN